jgi:Tol biopolymer transport system component
MIRFGIALVTVAAIFAADPATPPPGPVLFRAGEWPATVAPDGKTVYFPDPTTSLMITHLDQGQWSTPRAIPFTLDNRQGDPFFAPDGKRLYFWSNRPGPDGKAGRFALWASDIEAGGFAEPRLLEITIQGKPAEASFPAVAANGNLYFASRMGSLGRRDIFVARRVGYGYAPAENLGAPINTTGDEFDATISPDETTLVFARGGADTSRFFISRRKDGVWSEPRQLGPEVSFGFGSYCPTPSPDGRTLYFWSDRDGKPGTYSAPLPQ